MRVLIVASRYLPHTGGLETVVHTISKQLSLVEHAVSIITNRYPRRLPQDEVIDGLGVTRLQFLYPRMTHLRSGRVDLWLAGWFYGPLTLIQLFIIIRRFQPDVVNLQYLGSPGLFLWILQRLLHFRFVVSLHGGDVDGEPFQSRFNRWRFCAVLARANAVTVCSRALLQQALMLAPEIQSKARVIHNGVDSDLFANAHPYTHPRPYLLAVGQLSQHKGFDILLTAFVQVRQSLPGLDLLIAGDGEERAALGAQIKAEELCTAVELLGAVSHEQVASLMRGSRAIVIPSRREPFGIVAVEAMATGKPIVATNVGGLSEALEGACVTFVPPDDVSALADGLTRVLTQLNVEQNWSTSNREIARRFSVSSMTDQYLKVYCGDTLT